MFNVSKLKLFSIITSYFITVYFWLGDCWLIDNIGCILLKFVPLIPKSFYLTQVNKEPRENWLM